MLRSPNVASKNRLWVFYIFVFSIHLLLIGRFFKIQIIDNEIYLKRAKSNYVRALSIPAPRGLILDRNGKIIVDNYPTYVVYAIGAEVKNKNQNYSIISKAIGIDTLSLINNYKNYFRSRFLPAKIAKDLTIEQLSKLEENKNNLSGIIYEQFPERIYHPTVKATHVLGYLKEIDKEMINKSQTNQYSFGDLAGWSGIEKKYENKLRGQKGVSYYQVDAYGREAGEVDGYDNILSQPGQDINTTLDIDIQLLVEQIYANKKGAAIVSIPNTGEILAYVSSPDYNPSLFTGMVSSKEWQEIVSDPDRPLLNRAANGMYPPGSIYKMVVAAELLEKNLVNKNWSVFCTGEYEFYDRVHKCWDKNGHGTVNIESAIAQSCDVYFYEAIQKVRLDELEKRSIDFLHGVPTNIDLPSEMKGRVPNRKYMNKLYGRYGWSTGAMLNIAIGQGEILVTPIQMMAYTNLLATKGNTKNLHLVTPNLLSINNNVSISDETWNIIHDSMRKVV
ncbi:MAG: penicillin-binding protein 2, partial [Candidatus Neomarinimicrobiota bacterium]|nr:penicillin-binding protein 2 [Candidatus Neomarinimicrobiota bacterium]